MNGPNDPDDAARLKAFEFAQETTKQLLTLATGTIALTITFLKDLVKDAPDWAVWTLAAAWVAFLLSMVLGVFTLMALTGTVPERRRTVYDKGILIWARLQILSFLLAVSLTIVFGVAAARRLVSL